jgi:hypothetical protein
MMTKYKNAYQTNTNNKVFVLVRSYMIFKFNLHTLVKFRPDHTLFFCHLTTKLKSPSDLTYHKEYNILY